MSSPAGPINSTGATLKGAISSGAGDCVAWFEWGSDTNFGNRTASILIGSSGAISRTSMEIGGLSPANDYFFRLVGSNSFGITVGFPKKFTTGKKVAAWGSNSNGQTSVPSGLTNAVKVAGGWWHSLALKADGTVVCWGDNSCGQLNMPAWLTNVMAIAGGSYHSLVLRADRTLGGWGCNGSGQLNIPGGLTDAVDVACGADFSLALKADGNVAAWGDNGFGESIVPTGLSNVVAVAAGAAHALALKIDGTVAGWGYNILGQATAPVGLSNVVAITASLYGSLALKSDGSLVGWGELAYMTGLHAALAISAGSTHLLILNLNGSIDGLGSNSDHELETPVGLTNAAGIAAGGWHSLALGKNVAPVVGALTLSGFGVNDLVVNLTGSDANGDSLNFRVWSLPAKGSLYQYSAGGRGAPITAANTPVSDAPGRVIFAPALGGFGNPYDSFSFVANDGELDSAPATVTVNILPSYATSQPATLISSNAAIFNGMVTANGFPSSAWFEWGTNSNYGQRTDATNVGSGSGVVAVQSPPGPLNSGEIYRFRLVVSNASGIIYGAQQRFTTGRKITAWGKNDFGQSSILPGLTNVVGIATGGAGSLVTLVDGTMRGWGGNFFGELNYPTNIGRLASLAAGAWDTYGLKADGTIIGWGFNNQGQLSIPPDASNIVAVVAGDRFSLALKRNGSVIAWGGVNAYGETNVPSNLSNVVAIAAGINHGLALKNNGTVVAWGHNSSGQTNVPLNLSNVVAIAAGYSHSVALKSDGTVVAWGTNNLGQLNVPAGLSNVIAITAGQEFSMALKEDGTITAWGDNSFGALNIPQGLLEAANISGQFSSSMALGKDIAPIAGALTVLGFGINDVVINLTGSDANSETLNFRVWSLPAKGSLYQYNGGGRGAPIMAANMPVSDASGRVIFTPALGGLGNPYDSFSFVANDGELDSAPAAVTVNILPSYATSQPATLISSDAATFNGMVTANGFPSSAWFDWGTNSNYGQRTDAVNVGSGSGVVAVQLPSGPLTLGDIYRFRLVVSNASGIIYGAQQRFTTGRKITVWGQNDYGQTLVPLGLTNVVAVSPGAAYEVVLKNDGTTAAWGQTSHGEMGITNMGPNFAALSAGAYHGLALLSNGTVAAWGYNADGETSVPAGLSNVVMISAGSWHSLALKGDGRVVAWGKNAQTQTSVPSNLSNAVFIAAGGSHSLAIRTDGTVAGWGDNTYGEASIPANLSNVVALAGGDRHSLALKSDGTIVCWGDNTYGQLSVPFPLTNVVAIAAGALHSLVLTEDGRVVAWGWNAYNQGTVPDGLVAVNIGGSRAGNDNLVVGGNIPPLTAPLNVQGAGTNDVTIMFSGVDYNGDVLSFRIQSLPTNGVIFQYAGGARGDPISVTNSIVTDQLGRVIFAPTSSSFSNLYDSFSFLANDGQLDSAASSVTIYLPSARAMTGSATSKPGGAITINGSAMPNGFPSLAWFDWGTNNSYGNATEPVFISSGYGMYSMTADLSGLNARRRYSYRLVVSNALGIVKGAERVFSTGMNVITWGNNSFGQQKAPSDLTNIVAVSGGLYYSMALRSDGRVAAWGYNDYGQTNVPVGLTNVVAIGAGRYHALAVNAAGKAVGWGRNTSGQTNVPASVSNVVAVAGGMSHSLALRGDGSIAAWGDNSSGQTNIPSGLSNVVMVAAGDYHSLALKADGTVVAWGNNSFGQGVAPNSISNITAVACGASYNLVLKNDGTVTGWGYSGLGQPNPPATLSNVVAIAGSVNASMALRSDGTVATWGYNGYGQLSVPTNLNHVVGLAEASYHALAIGNRTPLASSNTVSGYVNHDLVIPLSGTDPDGDPLTFRITSLPTSGMLYQYDLVARGAAVLSPNTTVTDPTGRVYFAPEPGRFGSPAPSFAFAANDGLIDSGSTNVTVNIILPPAPGLLSPGLNSNGQFVLNFSGNSNASYSIWGSTNLLNWELLGMAAWNLGVFQFVDSNNLSPIRFYRARAP